jgi:hypothetical protein
MSIDSGEAIAAALQVSVVGANELIPPGPAGIYAWWVHEDHLGDASPRLPEVHIEDAARPWSLLYVGIGPKAPGFTDVGGSASKRSRGKQYRQFNVPTEPCSSADGVPGVDPQVWL